MARYGYLPYRMRRNRWLRRIYIGVAAALFIVVVLWLWPGRASSPGNTDTATQTQPERKPAAQDTSRPAPTTPREPLSPAVEPAAKPQPKPQAEPTPPPAANLPPSPADAIQTNPEAAARISQALQDTKAGKIIAARNLLNDTLLLPISSAQRQQAKQLLADLADKWLFCKDVPVDDNLCSYYKVQPGDKLQQIGERCKVPYEMLMQINNILRPENLQAGETIKIINGPFNATVSLSGFTMDLYLQRMYVRSFPVGHGKPDRETPTGRWRVKQDGKLVKPIWTDPDTGITYHPEGPDYPLGSRWIALEGIEGKAKGRTGFAIHGTKDPAQIGKRDSKGCIRLHNGDVILVYNVMVPVYSEVVVED